MKPIVTIENLNKSYSRVPVLENLNLTLVQGEIVGLLGPNGCGKTTLMKILTGLINDYHGEVRILEQPIGTQTKQHVSYLPEKTYLSDWMKAGYAIDMMADFYQDFDKNKALELLSRFQLSPTQKLKAMSKGMQEKVQLILVMSRNARLYVLDEPLSGVDAAARDTILDVILKNYASNATILLSTHLIYDVEKLFDSVIMMGYGKIILHNTVDGIREQYNKSVDEVFREVFKC